MLTAALILSTALVGGHKQKAAACGTSVTTTTTTVYETPVYASSCYSSTYGSTSCYSSRAPRKAFKFQPLQRFRRQTPVGTYYVAAPVYAAPVVRVYSAAPCGTVGYASYTSVVPGTVVQGNLPTPQTPGKNLPDVGQPIVVDDGPPAPVNPALAPVPTPDPSVGGPGALGGPTPAPNIPVPNTNKPVVPPIPDNAPVPAPVPPQN